MADPDFNKVLDDLQKDSVRFGAPGPGQNLDKKREADAAADEVRAHIAAAAAHAARSSGASERPGVVESLLHGGANSATLGFGDEIGAAIDSVTSRVQRHLPSWLLGTPENAPITTYGQKRDDLRREEERVREAHPWVYRAGELGGGLLTAAAIPGGAMGRGFAGAAKAGAAYGAAQGLGNSDTDLTTADGRGQALLDTTVGGVAGAGAGVLTHDAAGLAGDAFRRVARGSVPRQVERWVGDASEAAPASMRDAIRGKQDGGINQVAAGKVREIIANPAMGSLAKNPKKFVPALEEAVSKHAPEDAALIPHLAESASPTERAELARHSDSTLEVAKNLKLHELSPADQSAVVNRRIDEVGSNIRDARQLTDRLHPGVLLADVNKSLGEIGSSYPGGSGSSMRDEVAKVADKFSGHYGGGDPFSEPPGWDRAIGGGEPGARAAIAKPMITPIQEPRVGAMDLSAEITHQSKLAEGTDDPVKSAMHARIAGALKDLREAHMDSVIGKDWQALNREYAALKTIEPITSKGAVNAAVPKPGEMGQLPRRVRSSPETERGAHQVLQDAAEQRLVRQPTDGGTRLTEAMNQSSLTGAAVGFARRHINPARGFDAAVAGASRSPFFKGVGERIDRPNAPMSMFLGTMRKKKTEENQQ